MKAWLVTWEWLGKRAEKKNKVATIISSRASADTVAKRMEQLYVDSEFFLSERIEYAKNRKNTPYPARFGAIVVNGERHPFGGRIHCGHNPFLFGRMVDNICVESDSDWNQELKYDEIPIPTGADLAAKWGLEPSEKL